MKDHRDCLARYRGRLLSVVAVAGVATGATITACGGKTAISEKSDQSAGGSGGSGDSGAGGSSSNGANAGASGSAGKSGSAGNSGTGGNAGSAGNAGTAGVAGKAGSSGTSGSAGSGGTTSFECDVPLIMDSFWQYSCVDISAAGCPDVSSPDLYNQFYSQLAMFENCSDFCSCGVAPVQVGCGPDPSVQSQCCYYVMMQKQQICEGRPFYVSGRLLCASLSTQSLWV